MAMFATPAYPRLTLQALAAAATFGSLIACAAATPSPDDEHGSAGSSRRSGTLYVTLAGDAAVVAIDENDGEVSSTIPVGDGPAIILKTPDSSQLYTANWAGDSVSAIDVATEAVTTIPVAGRPYIIAMAPDGKHVYVGLSSNAIAVIETASNTVVRSMPTAELPASLFVSPDGETLYVATIPPAASTLRAIDAATGELLLEPIEVGSAPAWITMSHDGSYVYTLNFSSDDVSVVDTAAWEVVERVETGAGGQAIIGNVTPDDSELWVTNHGSAELLAISTQNNEVVRSIALDGRPVGVSFNDDGSRVYVTDFGPESIDGPVDLPYLLTGVYGNEYPGQVSIFDSASGQAVGDTIAVGPGATSAVFVASR